MPKQVLDIGNCGPDHQAIRQLIEDRFDALVQQAHHAADALPLMKRQRFDLILINRKLDQDYSDGIKLLNAIKSDPDIADLPVMLVTNYEEHQQLAMQAGGTRGFGKLALEAPETLARLGEFLA